jgi:hypothetical protein
VERESVLFDGNISGRERCVACEVLKRGGELYAVASKQKG